MNGVSIWAFHPSRPQTARGLGMDAVEWARQGLIDMLVITPLWSWPCSCERAALRVRRSYGFGDAASGMGLYIATASRRIPCVPGTMS
ncbi:MAG: hypothetical protein K0R67_459 [Paenibacillus sp.]|nr:hypothetical protein [Paenibacillus sp.]